MAASPCPGAVTRLPSPLTTGQGRPGGNSSSFVSVPRALPIISSEKPNTSSLGFGHCWGGVMGGISSLFTLLFSVRFGDGQTGLDWGVLPSTAAGV